MKRLWCAIILLLSGCAVGLPASPEAPRVGPFVAKDLPAIVITEATVPSGMTVDDELSGRDALVQPVALLDASTFAAQPGFVDARMTRVGTSGPDSYWREGGYVTWTALYDTAAAAAGAFQILVSEHESPTGWGMERAGVLQLGDEGVTLQGPAYGFDTLLHVWRTGNLLLAAVALGVTATGEEAPDGLRSIAEAMDARVTEPS